MTGAFIMRVLAFLLLPVLFLTGCGPGGSKTTADAVNAQPTVDTISPEAHEGAKGLLLGPDPVQPPQGKLGDTVEPLGYALNLVIDPEEDDFSGLATINVRFLRPQSAFWIHGQNLVVEAVRVIQADGSVISGQYHESEEPGVALVTLDDAAAAGQATLEMEYHAPFNKALDGLYKVNRDGAAYIVSQFEAIAARKAFPGFDESRFKVPFDIAITAPSDDVVIANTPEVKKSAAANGMTRHEFARTKPLPTYLIAMAVGPYDVVRVDDIPANDVRARAVPLRGIATKGNGKKMAYALKTAGPILATHEAYFGVPYPYAKLDLIAAPDYAFGAMENPGAVVFTEYLLLFGDKAPLRQKRASASVISHELAHQWFGDLVTPKWWDDIWLNEAFATWMGNKTLAAWEPEGEFGRNTLRGALGAMNQDALASVRKIHEPVKRNAAVMDSFDGITYQKGAGVLAMTESFVGAEAFRAGVQTHMKRFAFKTATADDFFTSLGEGSGHPEITAALRSFVDQPYTPRIDARLECTAAPTLSVRQSTYAPLGSRIAGTGLWQIPFCASVSRNGETTKVCKMLTSENETLDLGAGSCPDYIMPNAGGAGYYRFNLEEKDWTALIAKAADLPASEALVVRDSASAMLRAGAMRADGWLNLMQVLAQHPSWDVVTSSAGALANLRGGAVSWDNADLTAFTRNVFTPRFEQAKGDERGQVLLRNALKRTLAITGKDPDLRASLAASARKYIGDKAADNAADLSPSDMGLAFTIAVQDVGTSFADVLMARLDTERNPAFRGAALRALGATHDEKLAARLRDWALSDTLTGREATGLITGLLFGPLGGQSWNWFTDNFDAVLARMPDVRRQSAPNMASGFCSDDKAAAVKTFFESQSEKIPGYERPLAQTVEAIELCASFKKAKGKELAVALATSTH